NGGGSRVSGLPGSAGRTCWRRSKAPHPALRATFSHKGRRVMTGNFRLHPLLPLWEKVPEGRMRGRTTPNHHKTAQNPWTPALFCPIAAKLASMGYSDPSRTKLKRRKNLRCNQDRAV